MVNRSHDAATLTRFREELLRQTAAKDELTDLYVQAVHLVSSVPMNQVMIYATLLGDMRSNPSLRACLPTLVPALELILLNQRSSEHVPETT
jgi:hypothetical protein